MDMSNHKHSGLANVFILIKALCSEGPFVTMFQCYHRRMQRVASDLERLKGKLLSASDPKTAPLEAWPLVSGSRIAGQTRALSCDDKRLNVMVPTKEWQKELAALAADYVRRLNELLPGAVKYISFVTAEEAGKKA
jgi:hypothetical protein